MHNLILYLTLARNPSQFTYFAPTNSTVFPLAMHDLLG